jgi:glycosyltransferase involved in cell wall biosynthesis
MSTSKLSIGFDAKRYFHNTTGLGNYARWLIDGLSIEDDLNLVLFNPSNQTHTHPVYSAPLKKLQPFWRSVGIKKQIAASKIQVYHGLSNELPFGIHKTGVKSVVTIHDLINLKFPKNYPFTDRLIYAKKLSYAVKYADCIVVPSESTKEDLLHFFNADESKINVIGLSVKTVENPNISKPGKHLLCVSSFTERKNLVNLVQAYQLVKGNTPLIIAGAEGETYTKVQDLAKTDSRIELRTNVSNAVLSDLYRDAIYCIYPSIYEGFGIPILEAFSHKKVVATSNISSMPEVGGDAAMYFNPLHMKSIAGVLSTLLEEESRKRLEKNIPAQLLKFNSQHLLRTYKEVYQKLIN